MTQMDEQIDRYSPDGAKIQEILNDILDYNFPRGAHWLQHGSGVPHGAAPGHCGAGGQEWGHGQWQVQTVQQQPGGGWLW